jgi:CysZ protein
MEIIRGLRFNLRGLRLGFSSGRLLFWGLIRFILVLLITVALAAIIMAYQVEITEMLWQKPGSPWIAWLWHVVSWLVSLFLIGVSAILSFLVGQLLFSVLIMDHMSRITEFRTTGRIVVGKKLTLTANLLHLIKQEIPRMVLPLLFSFLLLVFGWITPFAPVVALLSAFISILFLSWDNTDLVPARRSMTFKKRFRFLLSTIPFHIGFGLPFLVPGLNLLFLSFAPVGATLYHVERGGTGERLPGNKQIV